MATLREYRAFSQFFHCPEQVPKCVKDVLTKGVLWKELHGLASVFCVAWTVTNEAKVVCFNEFDLQADHELLHDLVKFTHYQNQLKK